MNFFKSRFLSGLNLEKNLKFCEKVLKIPLPNVLSDDLKIGNITKIINSLFGLNMEQFNNLTEKKLHYPFIPIILGRFTNFMEKFDEIFKKLRSENIINQFLEFKHQFLTSMKLFLPFNETTLFYDLKRDSKLTNTIIESLNHYSEFFDISSLSFELIKMAQLHENYLLLMSKILTLEQWVSNALLFKCLLEFAYKQDIKLLKTTKKMLNSSNLFKGEFEVDLWVRMMDLENADWLYKTLVEELSKEKKKDGVLSQILFNSLQNSNSLNIDNKLYLFRILDSYLVFNMKDQDKILNSLDSNLDILKWIKDKKVDESNGVKGRFNKIKLSSYQKTSKPSEFHLHLYSYFYKLNTNSFPKSMMNMLPMDLLLRFKVGNPELVPKNLDWALVLTYFNYMIHNYEDCFMPLIIKFIEIYDKDKLINILSENDKMLDVFVSNQKYLGIFIQHLNENLQNKLNQYVLNLINNKDYKAATELFIYLIDHFNISQNSEIFKVLLKKNKPKYNREIFEKLGEKIFNYFTPAETLYLAENSEEYSQILYKFMILCFEGKIEAHYPELQDRFSVFTTELFEKLIKGDEYEKNIASLLILHNSKFKPEYSSKEVKKLQIPLSFSCLSFILRGEEPNFKVKKIMKKVLSSLNKEEEDSFYLQKTLQALVILGGEIDQEKFEEYLEMDQVTLNQFSILKLTLSSIKNNKKTKTKYLKFLIKQTMNQIESNNHKNIEIFLSEISKFHSFNI